MTHLSKKDAEFAIQSLIRGTIQRAVQETVACVLVVAAFTAILLSAEPGSSVFFGCLVILVAAGFISGVVWSFTLGYKLLDRHPASDRAFWVAAFRTQARLLKLVPLWYCGPMLVGIALFLVSQPLEPGTLIVLGIVVSFIAAVFAWVVWLNRSAARRLELVAAQLAE